MTGIPTGPTSESFDEVRDQAAVDWETKVADDLMNGHDSFALVYDHL